MSLSVRQIGQIEPATKSVIDQMQAELEKNQEIIYYLQDKMKSNMTKLVDVNAKVSFNALQLISRVYVAVLFQLIFTSSNFLQTSQRIEDKNTLLSNLTQLDDALSCKTFLLMSFGFFV